ncbi:hypothetical protein LTR70_005808 [Exophiala xenobiotica]|uniref:DUF1682-domain-containing protein n=1 Tax=Lithohypha guttulata TaxID=1690604 RepID=A0ABR0K0S3_9EURO|nr:hypothetical protein LTR24_008201 [Lithohypha guttulata]KAK5317613.1 hypothetical protein LTR70_005808 [Exophiala xenobiotica]
MDYFNKLVGNKPSQAPMAANVDDGFADYAAPAAASPVSIPASVADAAAADPTGQTRLTGPGGRQIVYTKWYRVWERTQLSDFYFELGVLPLILLALMVHQWGTRRNRRKARKFMASAEPILENEFALVGFGDQPKDVPYQEGTVQGDTLINAAAKLTGDNLADDVLKETTAFEFQSYATGRANTAFMDIKILLWKWYNPALLLVETLFGTFFESMKAQPERIEAVSYAFDGNEKSYVTPPVPGTEEINKPKPTGNSAYDQFIFAIVNKLSMRRLREERYDLSLTFTKDNAKLPIWASVMSESAEVTDTLLTADLVKAVETAGDYFEYLIVTDQPVDKPATIDEAKPRKRIHLCFRLPSDKDYVKVLPLFQSFIRLSDHLANNARFRPEVTKKIRQTRETESSKLKKVAEKEAEEDRMLTMEKLKKEERDRKMKGMTAEQQRKFLEKEADKKRRKDSKKMTVKG